MENTFWDRFVTACKRKNTIPTRVVRELGLSTGSPTAWKRGAEPEMSTTGLLSTHLGVSMAYLVGYEELEPATGTEPGAVSDEDLKFAMFGTTEISDEKLAEIRRYAQYIKDL